MLQRLLRAGRRSSRRGMVRSWLGGSLNEFGVCVRPWRVVFDAGAVLARPDHRFALSAKFSRLRDDIGSLGGRSGLRSGGAASLVRLALGSLSYPNFGGGPLLRPVFKSRSSDLRQN